MPLREPVAVTFKSPSELPRKEIWAAGATLRLPGLGNTLTSRLGAQGPYPSSAEAATAPATAISAAAITARERRRAALFVGARSVFLVGVEVAMSDYLDESGMCRPKS
jgi:hypothetical protein